MFDQDEVWVDSKALPTYGSPRPLIPVIDQAVTKIVGMPVVVNDPRLIRLVVKWKKETGSGAESDKMDNYLRDPKKVAELKHTFRG